MQSQYKSRWQELKHCHYSDPKSHKWIDNNLIVGNKMIIQAR